MTTAAAPRPNTTAEHVLDWARERKLDTWFAPETTSTNAVAKTETIRAPKLFLAEKQTAGRGRGDHTWTTPPNALLSTWAFSLTYAPQPILSPLVGLALFEAAMRAAPDLAFNLKAPNDLFLGDKKIAGLLIETVAVGTQVTCAIGLGFNAGDPPVGVDTATGLARHTQAEALNWPGFLDAWYDGVLQALQLARKSELDVDRRERLKNALNLHPLLKEGVLNVGPLGQIQTPTQLIDWHQL
jgi:BirA family biotin operon repressor/biotin-[acetyl-CoA-carboxylase] ligase